MTETAIFGGFYSLSCETYSGTGELAVNANSSGFLFAVVRDVQRNSCQTYKFFAYDKVFLFAVVRDVQRNLDTAEDRARAIQGFYSLSCETYSGTSASDM